MFRKMPIILLAVIALVAGSYGWLPPVCKSFLYGMSLSLKSLIVFVLPFLIFGLLFKAAAQLAKSASKWILFLLAAICVSNFCSTMLSYFVGSFAYHFDISMVKPTETAGLIPIGNFSLPKLVENSHAMFAGLLAGILFGWLRPKLAEKISSKLDIWIGILLKGFLYVIPLFIAGFIVKIMHDGILHTIVINYALILAMVVGAVFTYIAFIYLVANNFRVRGFIQSLKNMFPAMLAGFGSMSSAAAMPLTLLATEKNAKNRDVARSIIPATVNIHLIGDCFAIPIFAFAIMKSFGIPEPSFIAYLTFAAYFVLAKFSVAGVPGGGIIVMLPVLEAYLGFNGEMLSLITILYILFDPIITSANVLGNGGFAMMLARKPAT